MMRRNFTVAVLCLSGLVGAAFCQQPTVIKPASPDDQYVLGRDSQVQAGIPEGKVQEFTLKHSKVYPGMEHHGWLYIPAQYDGKRPIALMVFLDGTWYATRDGDWRTPVVLNNLIAKKTIPIMAAVFLDPGESTSKTIRRYKKGGDGSPLREDLQPSQRFVEYDILSAVYENFLLEEIIPWVRQHVRITDDPEGRGIGGCSSGGIGAFTVAWQRPDQFRKVLSFSGSFVENQSIYPSLGRQDGLIYPNIIRQADKKPIRVFLQSGAQDTRGHGEANEAMAAALDAKGYEYKFVFGAGGHCGMQGRAIFPDAMGWLWSGYSAPAPSG